MSDTLEIRLLGGFHIAYGDEAVSDFVSSKARALVAYLFVSERSWPRPILANLLWGDMPDAKANANLRVALSNLRRLLGAHLEIGRDAVGINPYSEFLLDVRRFQALMRAGLQNAAGPDSTRLQSTVELVEEAVGLYQGEFLEGLHIAGGGLAFEEWALLQRENLHQVMLRALYRLSSYHSDCGNYDQAIEYTARLLALQPWHEQAHRQMMLLQALVGDRSAALRQYETCRRTLAQELQAEPVPETNALLARIRDGVYDIQPTDPSKSARPRLFGRKTEQSWMRAQWALARREPARLTLVEGQMGLGKTALVREALRFVHTSSDATVLRARCLDFHDSVPYQPIADLLRAAHQRRPDASQRLELVWRMELAQLLPELTASMPELRAVWTLRDGDTARRRLYESVAQFLQALCYPPPHPGVAPSSARTKPARPTQLPAARAHAKSQTPNWLVLFLDDLQWADPATFDLLRYLSSRLRGLPWWLIGAYQPEGMASDHPLLKLRHALAQEGRAEVLTLAPLNGQALWSWAKSHPGLPDAHIRRVVDYVMGQSRGNPLIAAELISELKSTALHQRPDGGWELRDSWVPQPDKIPFAVRELVLLKLGRLSDPARRLLCIAAAIGYEFDVIELEQATGGPEATFRVADEGLQDTTQLLEQGLEHDLITLGEPSMVDGAGTYRFATHMIRNVAYEQLSPWQRRKVQERLAETSRWTARPSLDNEKQASPGGVIVQLPRRNVAG